MKDVSATPFRLGWEEWVGLPALGLPALKAKVDTGARTSALHAFDIEPFGPVNAPKVRFAIHPVPGRHDLTIPCSARIVDRREVISSNGEMEYRYVIRSEIEIGPRRWPVEITLTDRGAMAYRMLIGRQALAEGVTVSPTESFLQPERGYEVYSSAAMKTQAPPRTLRIAVLSREGGAYSTRRLVAEGEARGHVVEVLDTTRCYLAINALEPAVHYDGQRLPRFDAVVPRIGVSVTAYGAAVLRQFEAAGTFVVNPSDGILASRDKLMAHQVLARHRVPMPVTAIASSPKDTDNLIGLVGQAPLVVKLLESTQGKGVVLAETRKAAQSVISAFRGLKADFLVQQFVKEAGGEDIRALVIGGRIAAAMRRVAAPGEFRSNLHQGGRAEPVKLTRAEREVALRAARAFRLGLAGVDMLRSAEGPKVLEVNSSPGFEGVEAASNRNVAAILFEEIERRVRPAPARRLKD
ncbi:30S ribosomal protein S6--L-glutamate ligase [Frigidibacter oleivorans]|uniref:30S ribosomal protein S6--L-glutamate ligase n=1 Tax=Frigidibacter oleivorans TaxID=2487129 RepID=UPI000F8D6F37|nr:30S ribosomal protein S6--L-glutamate ligase [Frigidibacter oleivorans]